MHRYFQVINTVQYSLLELNIQIRDLQKQYLLGFGIKPPVCKNCIMTRVMQFNMPIH